MARRERTDGRIRPQALDPQARPVDTYYVPQERSVAPPPKTNSLLQLTEALKQIQPSLDKFAHTMDERSERQSEQEKLKAQAIANELAARNQTDWNSAIKDLERRLKDPNLSYEQKTSLEGQLKLFQSSNPWRRIYYDKAKLSEFAMGLDQAIRTEWATSPVRESDSMDAFDRFYDERVQAGLQVVQGKYHERAMVEDFWPTINKSRSALLTEHINYRQQQNIEQTRTAFGSLMLTKTSSFGEAVQTTLVDKTIEIGDMENLSYEQKLAAFTKERNALYQQWGNDLSAEAKKAINMSLSGTEVNQLTAKAIIGAAAKAKNPKLLELADFVTTRDGAKLSGIPEIQTMLNEARRSINTERFTDIQREDALEDRERKQFLRKAQTEIFDTLMANPWADLSQYKKDFLSDDRQMGEEFLEVLQVQRKLQEQHRSPIPKGRASASNIGTYVYGGGSDIKPVNQAYLKGDLTNEEYRHYGQIVGINRERENRDSGLAALKRELTDTAVKYASDRYKLVLPDYALNRESRIQSRNVQVQTEVRRSIDEWIREQEKGGTSPSRDDLNEYIWNRLIPRLDKQYGVGSGQSNNKPAGQTLTTQQANTMIQQVQKSTLKPADKQKAIQAIKARMKQEAKQ